MSLEPKRKWVSMNRVSKGKPETRNREPFTVVFAGEAAYLGGLASLPKPSKHLICQSSCHCNLRKSAVNTEEELKARRPGSGWIVKSTEVAVKQERGKTGGVRDQERRVAWKSDGCFPLAHGVLGPRQIPHQSARLTRGKTGLSRMRPCLITKALTER